MFIEPLEVCWSIREKLPWNHRGTDSFSFPFHIPRDVCCRLQLKLTLFVNKENGKKKSSDQLKVYSSKCLKAFIPCSIFLQFCNGEFARNGLRLFLIQGRMTVKAWLFLTKAFKSKVRELGLRAPAESLTWKRMQRGDGQVVRNSRDKITFLYSWSGEGWVFKSILMCSLLKKCRIRRWGWIWLHSLVVQM